MSYSQIVPSVLTQVSAVLHPGSKYSKWTGCHMNGLYAIGSGQKNSGDCADVCPSISLLMVTASTQDTSCVKLPFHALDTYSDRFDSAQGIIKIWQGNLDPVSFVSTMSKTQCAANDFKGNPSLWILLCEEVLVRLEAGGTDFCVTLLLLCGVHPPCTS